LIQDGSAVSRTTYATLNALFAAAGYPFGDGDGSTTFNLPDHRARTSAGYDPDNSTGLLTGAATGGISAAAIGNTGGVQTAALVAANNGPHTHGVTDPGHDHDINDQGHSHTGKTPVNNSGSFGDEPNPPSASGTGVVNGYAEAATTAQDTGITVNSNTTGITTQSQGSGQAFNVVQPTFIAVWIIRAL
jgi:microcystin-dependent protein